MNAFITEMAKLFGHIREDGLCREWPLREGLLYTCIVAKKLVLMYWCCVL